MTEAIKWFRIEDDLSIQEGAAIEVLIELQNGELRWCFFTTPNALSKFGDWIEGTKVRFHYGAPHMIVVDKVLDEEIIEKVLRDIDSRGEILECTMPTSES